MNKVLKIGISVLLIVIILLINGFTYAASKTTKKTLKLDITKLTIDVDDFEKIRVKTSNKNVGWVSSDPSVAEVDENGNVYGNSMGTAVITATDGEGNYADCKVNVVETEIRLSKTEGTISIRKNNTNKSISI